MERRQQPSMASAAGPSVPELRILLLTLEYAEPWIFSGNGVYSRSFVQNLTRGGGTKVLVLCGRPAGQLNRAARPPPSLPTPSSTMNGNKAVPSLVLPPGTSDITTTTTDNVTETIREGSRVEIHTVSLPVWFKLDRHSSWKEFGEGVSRFSEEVGQFRPDIVLGVDWTSRGAWETLKKNSQQTRLQNVPFVYLCFRVFSSTPGLCQEDRTFYSQREAETIQSAVRTVALSRCDAVALDALRTMTLPRGAEALRAASGMIQVITPPLRDDVRNSSVKLTKLPMNLQQQLHGSTKKWSSWSHTSLGTTLAPSTSSSTASTDASSFITKRAFITCCCRISPEKDVMRFVEICEKIQVFLKENDLIPYVVGPAADEDYARRVYQKLKRAFPGDSSIIVSDFVPADKLQSIFAKTVLNIHPARMEPFGMTITEAAAFGVPTLLDGGGFVGATDVLPFTENCSIACNMRSVRQTSLLVKCLLRKSGRSFLELIGKRAQDAVLRWGSAEWAAHVRKELLDDVLRNAFRAYSGTLGTTITKNEAANPQAQEDHPHQGDDTWPWLSMTEWTAVQLSLAGGEESGDKVLDFDLDGVRLVVEQLLKLSAYSLATLLLNLRQSRQPAPVEMDADMYEWAWFLLSRHNACLGPARFRLVPSKMSEDTFWGLLFAVMRDGVVRLVSSNKSKPIMDLTVRSDKAEDQGDEMSSQSPVRAVGDGSVQLSLDFNLEAMERLVQRDECARGIAPIVNFVGKGVLGDAARSIFAANRVLILTGFPCVLNSPSPQETDGPPGAVAMAKACVALGKRVFFLIEEPNAGVLRACIGKVFAKTRSLLLRSHEGVTTVETFGSKGQVTLEIFPSKSNFSQLHYDRLDEILIELSCDRGHMIAIERSGPASDGVCRTMRTRAMGDNLLAPLHLLFERAKQFGVGTTGIGDGGNEVGMGAAYDVVQTRMGKDVACVIGCDFLLPSSVSNWGGYAICAALALVALHNDRFQGAQRKTTALEACIGTDTLLHDACKACVDAGGADGVTGNRDSVSVDGLPFSKSLEVVQALRVIVEKFDE